MSRDNLTPKDNPTDEFHTPPPTTPLAEVSADDSLSESGTPKSSSTPSSASGEKGKVKKTPPPPLKLPAFRRLPPRRAVESSPSSPSISPSNRSAVDIFSRLKDLGLEGEDTTRPLSPSSTASSPAAKSDFGRQAADEKKQGWVQMNVDMDPIYPPESPVSLLSPTTSKNGEKYSSGLFQLVKKDFKDALDLLQSDNEKTRQLGLNQMKDAAFFGYDKAQFQLFLIFKAGMFGIEKDADLARYWLQKAAENENEPNVEALTYLGYFHQYGEYGFDRDATEAFRLYEIAANKKHSVAVYNVALCYWRGIGVERNYSRALKLMEEAANLGELDASKFLHILNQRCLTNEEEAQIIATQFVENQREIQATLSGMMERINYQLVKQFVMVLTIKFIHHQLKKDNRDFSLIKEFFPATYAYQESLVRDVLDFFKQKDAPRLTPMSLRSLARYIASQQPLVSHRDKLPGIYQRWAQERLASGKKEDAVVPVMRTRFGF